MSIPVEEVISYLQQKAQSIQKQNSVNELPLIKTPAAFPVLYDINKNYATPEQMEENGRDWTYEHIRTLIYWMNIANINIFLLDASIQHYKKIVMQVMAFTFLFSSLSTTISLSQLGIDAQKNPGLADGIKYTFVVASTISTILVGYVKLFKLQEMMDADIEMHKDWLEFATKISGELQMPKRLRTPALKLLQDMKESYIGLFCKRPFVPGMVKRYANRYFMNYTQSAIEERSCLCCARHNYIKRTNIFFVFQDIMKNEIKRLAAEIEVGNTVVNENDDPIIDGPLAAGTELGRPKLPTSSELKQNFMIRYIYDGPFISIEVIENPSALKGERRRSDSPVSVVIEPSYRRAALKSEKKSEGRKTMFKAARRKLRYIGGGGGVASETDSEGSIDDYRPRAASFQAPERALYTQMQYRSTEPPPRGSEMGNKSSSFAFKQNKDIGDLVKKINEEIVANRRKSTITPLTASAIRVATENKNAGANDDINRLFPMATENDGSSIGRSSMESEESSTDSHQDRASHSSDSLSKQ